MIINTSKGDISCNSKEELAKIIKCGSALPGGDEILMNGDDEYPYLSILVNGQYACVHYFAEKDQDICIWQSYGDSDKEVTFFAGAGDAEWTAPEDTIVPLEAALKCMEEFYDTMNRPECIEWQEL